MSCYMTTYKAWRERNGGRYDKSEPASGTIDGASIDQMPFRVKHRPEGRFVFHE